MADKQILLYAVDGSAILVNYHDNGGGIYSPAPYAPLRGKSAASNDTELNARIPADGDSLLAGLVVNATPRTYNGSTLDILRGVESRTLLASAARTATTTSATQINQNSRGIVLFLVVSATSATSLTVRLLGVDPLTSNNAQISATPTGVTTTGTFIYVIYPGGIAAGATSGTTAQVLPGKFQVTVVHGDANPVTYSLTCCLLP